MTCGVDVWCVFENSTLFHCGRLLETPALRWFTSRLCMHTDTLY